jgi:protein-disulfide isomerase
MRLCHFGDQTRTDALNPIKRPFALAVALFSGVLLVAASHAASKKAATPNWLLTFAVGAEGGNIIGNPNAPVKLIEYASYTCIHCANFETNEAPVLRSDYIAKGKVSLEIRPMLLNALDVPMTLLAKCGSPGRFFGNHRIIMARRASWIALTDTISDATQKKLDNNDFPGFNMDVYRALKLSSLAKERGLSEAMVQKCMTDPKMLAAIIKISDDASDKYNVRSTPSFFVNGELKQDAHSLDSLKPYLTSK